MTLSNRNVMSSYVFLHMWCTSGLHTLRHQENNNARATLRRISGYDLWGTWGFQFERGSKRFCVGNVLAAFLPSVSPWTILPSSDVARKDTQIVRSEFSIDQLGTSMWRCQSDQSSCSPINESILSLAFRTPCKEKFFTVHLSEA